MLLRLPARAVGAVQQVVRIERVAGVQVHGDGVQTVVEQGGVGRHRHLEPALADHWIERLDSNCCLGWQAMVALKAMHPTIPFDEGFGGAGTRRTR